MRVLENFASKSLALSHRGTEILQKEKVNFYTMKANETEMTTRPLNLNSSVVFLFEKASLGKGRLIFRRKVQNQVQVNMKRSFHFCPVPQIKFSILQV